MDRERDRAVRLDGLSGYQATRGERNVRGWDVAEERREKRPGDRGGERRDDGGGRQREPQRAEAPIVERERAIVPLDPPTR